jgi:hypothetical protein
VSRRRARLFNTVALLALGLAAAPAAYAQPAASDAVALEFPNQSFPENLPSAEIAALYPQSWTTYASAPGRNAVFPMPATAP